MPHWPSTGRATVQGELMTIRVKYKKRNPTKDTWIVHDLRSSAIRSTRAMRDLRQMRDVVRASENVTKRYVIRACCTIAASGRAKLPVFEGGLHNAEDSVFGGEKRSSSFLKVTRWEINFNRRGSRRVLEIPTRPFFPSRRWPSGARKFGRSFFFCFCYFGPSSEMPRKKKDREEVAAADPYK